MKPRKTLVKAGRLGCNSIGTTDRPTCDERPVYRVRFSLSIFENT